LNNHNIRIILSAIAIIFVLMSTASAQNRVMPRNPEIDRTLKSVQNLIRLGDFEKGIYLLNQLRDKHGNQERILSIYKHLYTEAKMYPELESTIRVQLRTSPKNPIILAELGNALYLRDKFDSADSLWNLAISLSGTNQAVYLFVANYKLRYGDYKGAAEVYRNGRSTLGKPSVFATELAGIYEAQQNYSGAVAEYIGMLDGTPASVARASIRIRGVLDITEDIDEIISTVKDGLKGTGKTVGLYEILGDLYIKIGKMEDAVEAFRNVGKINKDDGESLVKYADRCLHFKIYEPARLAIEEYLESSKNTKRRDSALLIKAKAEIAEGLYDNAILTLDLLIETAKDDRVKDEAGYLFGGIYMNYLKDYQKAIDIWEGVFESIKRLELKRRISVDIGICYIKIENFEKAEEVLLTVAANSKPDIHYNKAMFLLGEIHLIKNDYDKAKKYYVNLITSNPGGDFSNNALERLSVIEAIGIDDSGITADNSILDQFAASIKAWLTDDFNLAAELILHNKLTDSPIAEQTYFYINKIHLENGDKTKAEKSLNNYIELYPDGFYVDRAYLMLGDIYLDVDDNTDRAVTAYNKILELFPNGTVVELARDRLRQLKTEEKIG